MNPNTEPDPQLTVYLQTLEKCAPRSEENRARARAAFLAQAAEIKPSVSKPAPNRLNDWKSRLRTFQLFNLKEQNPMMNVLMIVLVTSGLILFGGTTTVSAAQTAIPGELLYPVKTWSEDVRLGWENEPLAKLELELQYSARRAAEINSLVKAGDEIPEPVIARFEHQQQNALELSVQLPEDQAQDALLRFRNQTQQMNLELNQVTSQNPATQLSQARIRSMLQTQEQLAADGIQNQAWLRQQLRNRQQNQWMTQTPAVMTTQTTTETPAGNPSAPAAGFGPGSLQGLRKTGTPTPGAGFGPGGAQNPWTTGTPTPGSGYGPGSCTLCTPELKKDNNSQDENAGNQNQNDNSGNTGGENNNDAGSGGNDNGSGGSNGGNNGGGSGNKP